MSNIYSKLMASDVNYQAFSYILIKMFGQLIVQLGHSCKAKREYNPEDGDCDTHDAIAIGCCNPPRQSESG